MGQLGDLSPAGSVAIGILVGLLSTSIQSIGLTLQRKSHLLEDEKEDELIRRPPYRRRRWQLGMSMFVVSNLVGSTIQITTLPLPVLSTLQASGLVFNTICAALLLGEPFTRWSLCGTILVAGGALLIAMFGALPEPSHTLDQLLFLLGRDKFIVWMVFTILMIFSVLLFAWILSRITTANTSRTRLWRGMCFGSVSSILSAHSLLMAKSAVELVVRTIVDHVNQFNRWQSWIILLVLLFLALSQLYFLHRGLKLCSTSVLYPFVFCIYNIVAILDGLIYFRQTDRLPALHAGLIALGTAILLSGVLALSWRLGDEDSVGSPSDAHTLLTPGMGIVEDTTTEDEIDNTIYDPSYPYDSEDEEAAIQSSERVPLLRSGRSLDTKSRDNVVLRLTRKRRQDNTAPIEAFDIWNELCDMGKSPQFRSLNSRRAGRRASTVTYTAKKSLSAMESDEDAESYTYADTDEELISPFTIMKRKVPSGRHKRARTIHAGVGLFQSTSDSIKEAGRRTSSQTLSKDTGQIRRPVTPTGNISPFHARHLQSQERRNRWSMRHRSKSSPLAQPETTSSSQLRRQDDPSADERQNRGDEASDDNNARSSNSTGEGFYELPHQEVDLVREGGRLVAGTGESLHDGQNNLETSYGAIHNASNSTSHNSRRHDQTRRSTVTGTGARRRRDSSMASSLLDWWRRPERNSSNNI